LSASAGGSTTCLQVGVVTLHGVPFQFGQSHESLFLALQVRALTGPGRPWVSWPRRCQRLEVFPRQPQSAGAMDLRMTGQDLLHERGAGRGKPKMKMCLPEAGPQSCTFAKNCGVNVVMSQSTERPCAAGRLGRTRHHVRM
jgi:hypothetical protein